MISKLAEISKKSIMATPIKLIVFLTLKLISIIDEFKGILRVNGLFGGKYKSLIDYKDIHKEDRCFIIATGPSLTIEDLSSLKNEYTFGMNSIVKKYGEIEFRPTYYGIQDYNVYKSIEGDILKWYGDSKNVFISDRIQIRFKTVNKWNVFPLFVAYHSYENWFNDKFKCKFSDDIYRRTYDCFSITISLMQIACYMGFKEIYLIGADCSYSKDQVNHFAEHGVVDGRIDTAAMRNINGYEAAKKYADKHGIKIYNATRGGELEVFERVDIDNMKLK